MTAETFAVVKSRDRAGHRDGARAVGRGGGRRDRPSRGGVRVLAGGVAGQDCCSRSRILVERKVFDRFLELLEPAVHDFEVGDPGQESTRMGPLISAAHREHVASFVPEDAPVAFRGSAPEGAGYWFAPTVLAPLSRSAPAFVEEIIGPVVGVVPFEDEADAVRIANDTIYGLPSPRPRTSSSPPTDERRRGVRDDPTAGRQGRRRDWRRQRHRTGHGAPAGGRGRRRRDR